MTKNEAKAESTPHLDEINRLKKENLRLTEERDLRTKQRRTLPAKFRKVRLY